MRGIKRVLGRRRNRLIVLLLIFLLIDAALVGYTFTYTTATKEGTLLQSDLVVSEAKISAFGSMVIMAEDSLYMLTPSGLVKFEGSDNLTSYAFGYLSEAVALITEQRVLRYYPRGSLEPSFSKALDSDSEVLCIQEMASVNDYIPVNIAVLASNQTGSFFMPLSINGQGTVGAVRELPGSVLSHASARSGGYITLACDDGSLVTFRMSHDDAVANFPFQGDIDDMTMIDNGMKLFVLFHGGSIQAVKPANGFVYSWTNLTDAVDTLVLAADGESVYALDGDRLMLVSGPEGVSVFSGEDIGAFFVPGTGELLICQNDLVSLFKSGRADALWEGWVQGTIAGVEADFGASFILVWTQDGGLYSFDNSVPTLGAKEWWTAFGIILIIQLMILVGLAWGKSLVSSGSHGVIVLFAGAMAGLVYAMLFPDQSAIGWFGSEVALAVIVAASGAVASYASWESGSGAWGVILGIIAGGITAAVTGMLMMFLLWTTGMEFGDQDAFFYTLVNSVPAGFLAGIFGAVVGLILTYVFLPGEKKARG
ncbi:MAG: hypothetical protein LUQ16_09120 [Methanomassiliicoccales archaeon]|nr:hypothetical protein [Methanomassiliicoccales archaeon]